jgi:hypothetical protein
MHFTIFVDVAVDVAHCCGVGADGVEVAGAG